MTARCIQCRTEIGEGPLCEHCAPLVAATINRGVKARPTRRNLYRRHGPEPPPAPVTLATVRFGRKAEETGG